MSSTNKDKSVPTQFQKVGNLSFAYHTIDTASGVPFILFNLWGAVLDNFDPRNVSVLESISTGEPL